MKNTIVFLTILCFTHLAKANRPTIYLDYVVTKNQLTIQSKLLWDVNKQDNTYHDYGSGDNHSALEKIPAHLFTAEGDTINKFYTINDHKIKVQAFFPIQENGRRLIATTYVKLTVFIDGKKVVDTNSFGQLSDEFVSYDLYCRPLSLQLSLEGEGAQATLKGEYSCLMKYYEQFHEYCLGDDYESFSLTYLLDGTSGTVDDEKIKQLISDKYSKSFNRLGEKKYHEKDLLEAEQNYLRAVYLDKGFAQAYSNLALVYYKQEDTEKAIWANGQAIAKASGNRAYIVKANSNYNLGKIYERAKDYGSALKHYQLAEGLNPKNAYRMAIERVSASK